LTLYALGLHFKNFTVTKEENGKKSKRETEYVRFADCAEDHVIKALCIPIMTWSYIL